MKNKDLGMQLFLMGASLYLLCFEPSIAASYGAFSAPFFATLFIVCGMNGVAARLWTRANGGDDQWFRTFGLAGAPFGLLVLTTLFVRISSNYELPDALRFACEMLALCAFIAAFFAFLLSKRSVQSA